MSPSWNTSQLRCTVIHPAWGFLTLLYCFIIYLVSSTSGILPEKPVFPGEDKLGHVIAYAGLTFVVSMGMRHARVRASLPVRLTGPIVFVAIYGLFDVIHQREVPGRTGDVRDWFANIAGAVLAQAIIYGYAYYSFLKFRHASAHGPIAPPIRPLPPPIRHAHWAVSSGLLSGEHPEVIPFRKEKIRDESRRHMRILSEWERKRLLSACKVSRDLMLYNIVVVALCTGLRREELLGLRWDHVDFRTLSLVIETDEGDVRFRRVVPLVGPALHCIVRRAEERRPDAEYVFAAPNRTGRPLRPDNLRRGWNEAVKRAGVKDFSFRDLRQTTAFYLTKSGASPDDILEILGRAGSREQLSLAEKRAIFERMIAICFMVRSNHETKK